ncbi:MAG: DUF4097 family beta strand repeat-containing protein [Gemmatimonadota bacterium]|nr:DUF4097 family beta strand repeat-containing protein [Gemmatimonadota bacterium]
MSLLAWLRRLVALGLLAGGLAAPLLAQRKVERRIAIDANASIRLWNNFGSIRVIGWDRDSLAVTATLGRAAEGGLRFGGKGQFAKLFVDAPTDGRADAAAQIEVHVPRRSRVWIKTMTADVEVVGMTGALDANSVSGRMRISGMLRELNAETMDGDLEIDATASVLRAKTASGGIRLRGGGDDVGLTTVSGALFISGEKFQGARVESVTGDIHFDGRLDRNGSFTFESHSGAIELAFPAEMPALIEIRSFAGEIRNQYSNAVPTPGPTGRGRQLTVGSEQGGASVSVRSFKGIVTLRRR